MHDFVSKPGPFSPAALLALACTVGAAACAERDPLTAPKPAAGLVLVGPSAPSPLIVDPYVQVEVGFTFTCSLRKSGSADCWGSNSQSFPGDAEGVTAGQGTNLLTSFKEITSGTKHSCALDQNGFAWCWGSNDDGRLGIVGGASVMHIDEPAGVGSAHQFKAISAGDAHTCAVDVAGAAWCWGDNRFGQLGAGFSGGAAFAPIAVAGGLNFESISAGFHHSCGITTAKQVVCWGQADAGQLGVSPLPPRQCSNNIASCAVTPQPLGGVTGGQFSVVSAGLNHSCGVTTGGMVYCWGLNDRGQIGDGYFSNTTNAFTPVAIASGLSFATVSAGLEYSCALTTAGSAYCWGDNAHGKLGSGAPSSNIFNFKRDPTPVSGNLSFSRITAGTNHTCGVQAGGARIYCWGSNSEAQLGDGTHDDRFAPVAARGW